MALTKCNVSTDVIGSVGTSPAERGLTTQQFKDKFDEMPEGIKTYLNDTLTVEVDAHVDSKSPHPNTPAARAYHNANQSINDNTLTTLAFNGERFDTDTMHDNSTNNSRLTCKTAGKYDIRAQVDFAAHATGIRTVLLKLNGTTIIGMIQLQAVSVGGYGTRVEVGTLYDLAVNDYVEVQVNQTSGGALNVLTGANYSPEFMMVKVA